MLSPGRGERRRMPQSYAKLYYHIVFSTHDRVPQISGEIKHRLYEYVSGILRNKDCKLIKAGGTADHIHLLAILSREVSVSEILREIKTNSSKWIHETFAESAEFVWQRGYGAFTVGFRDVDRVARYIEDQEEHHRTKTFKEEFVELLNAHDVEYDLKYLWE